MEKPQGSTGAKLCRRLIKVEKKGAPQSALNKIIAGLPDAGLA